MYNITKKELAHVRVESREKGVKHIVNAERQRDCMHSNIEVVVARKGGNIGVRRVRF